jgi:hypothetical protein
MSFYLTKTYIFRGNYKSVAALVVSFFPPGYLQIKFTALRIVLNSFERLLDTFCRLKLGSRRRAIKITYCPWAIRENPVSSAANQIA